MSNGFVKFIGFVLLAGAIGLVGVRGLFTGGLALFSAAPAVEISIAAADHGDAR